MVAVSTCLWLRAAAALPVCPWDGRRALPSTRRFFDEILLKLPDRRPASPQGWFARRRHSFEVAELHARRTSSWSSTTGVLHVQSLGLGRRTLPTWSRARAGVLHRSRRRQPDIRPVTVEEPLRRARRTWPKNDRKPPSSASSIASQADSTSLLRRPRFHISCPREAAHLRRCHDQVSARLARAAGSLSRNYPFARAARGSS